MVLHRVLAGFFLLTAACAEDRPPPAESVDLETSVASASAADEEEPEAPREASAPPKICTPGAVRECKLTWRTPDAPNVLNCILSTQSCREDGYAWNPCDT